MARQPDNPAGPAAWSDLRAPTREETR